MANQYDYIDAGFRVFGLLGDKEDDGAELPPEQRYKKPRVSNWQHTPDWSDDQLEMMEQLGYFDTGYGVLVSGYLVIDIDPRNGGFESYKAMAHDYEADSGFVVRTGGGGLHIYFKAPEGVSLVSKLPQYPGIDFKSSGYVVGCGSLHASGSHYEAIKGSPDKVADAPQVLIDLIKRPDRYRAAVSGSFMDVSIEDVKNMLSFVSPDCDYDVWIKCGMAINQTLNGEGFDVWNDWSKNGTKYPGITQLERHWHSFGKSSNPVTLGTLKHFAEDGGYVESVTFSPDVVFEQDDSPVNIDCLRPPGFVGDLTQWINSQSFFPREHLAVAAALTAVGAIAGLRYEDDLDGFTPNLFTLCVAGSSTGKEQIQQCYADILRAAGVSAALHGSIKSEQEMLRNLVRHQASHYCIDEFGILLKKLVNAGSKAGASYLEGVIGFMMSVYTKANSYLPVGGDMKDALKDELKREIAACQKTIDNNEDRNGYAKSKLESAIRTMAEIDKGLKNPLATMIGFTTPVTFNELVSFEMATNGFISRAMIFDEPETNPMPNKKRGKKGMPMHIEMQLASIYSPGATTAHGERIEYNGDRVKIPSTEDARNALGDISMQFWQMAEDAKETGLEAIPRRGYELVSKISLILAIPSGLRTIEHVNWANAIAKADIQRKMQLAYANMQKDEDPANSIATKINAILANNPDGITRGVLLNRCRPAKKEVVEKVIDAMVEQKLIFEHDANRGKKRYTVKAL